MAVLTSNPWENAWIIIGLIVASAAGLSLIMLGGVGLSRSGFIQWMAGSFQQLLMYAPNALLFFGFMSDIVNQEVNRSIPSIVGLIGVMLTWVLGKAKIPFRTPTTLVTPPNLPGGPLTSEPPTVNPFTGGGDPLFCTIPGLSLLESDLAPQNLVMTVSILFYYLLSEWTSDVSKSIGLSATAGIIIISQIVSLYMNDCLGRFKFSDTSKSIPVVVGILLGAAYGGIFYSIWEKVIIPKLQASGSPVSGAFKSVEPSQQSKDGKTIEIGKPGEQVSADLEDGDYELVGELFKDGELITSSIVD